MSRRFTAPILAAVLTAAAAIGLGAQGERLTVSIPEGADILAECAGGVLAHATDEAGLIVSCNGVTPTPTATPGAEWWLAGGVDPADVVGAWKAKGAASYAASLVSMSGGSALYAPVSAPTWTASKGWQGGQNNRLQVVGEAYPAYGWSYVLRVRNAARASQQFMGCRNTYGDRTTGMDLNNTGAYQEVSSFNPGNYGSVVLTGTMAIGGPNYWTDGVLRSPTMVPGTGGACTVPLMILTNNWGGAPHGGGFQTEVQGVAVYSDTLTSGQVAAIATAIAGW